MPEEGGGVGEVASKVNGCRCSRRYTYQTCKGQLKALQWVKRTLTYPVPLPIHQCLHLLDEVLVCFSLSCACWEGGGIGVHLYDRSQQRL